MAGKTPRRIVGFVLLIIAAVAALPEAHPRTDVGMRAHTAIMPKGIPTRGKLDFNRDALPREVRGKFPSFDGDSFDLNLPPRVADHITAEQVMQETVAPLLKGMGYGSRLE